MTIGNIKSLEEVSEQHGLAGILKQIQDAIGHYEPYTELLKKAKHNANVALGFALNSTKIKEKMDWLSMAKENDPNHPFFLNIANIQELVTCNLSEKIEDRILHCNHELFHANTQWLAQGIAPCEIGAIVLGGQECRYDHLRDRILTEYFEEFLKMVKHVEILKLICYSGSNGGALESKHVQLIANGLRYNTSIKKLILTDQYNIGDEALNFIIKAIDENPNSILEQVDIKGITAITTEGAETLRQCLERNKPRREQCLESDKLRQEQCLERNKQRNEQALEWASKRRKLASLELLKRYRKKRSLGRLLTDAAHFLECKETDLLPRQQSAEPIAKRLRSQMRK